MLKREANLSQSLKPKQEAPVKQLLNPADEEKLSSLIVQPAPTVPPVVLRFAPLAAGAARPPPARLPAAVQPQPMSAAAAQRLPMSAAAQPQPISAMPLSAPLSAAPGPALSMSALAMSTSATVQPQPMSASLTAAAQPLPIPALLPLSAAAAQPMSLSAAALPSMPPASAPVAMSGTPLSPYSFESSDGSSSASSPMMCAPSSSPCTSPSAPLLPEDQPLDASAASRPSSCFTAEDQSETGVSAMVAKINQLQAALAELKHRAAPTAPQPTAPASRPAQVQRHIWSATQQPATVIVKTEPRAAAAARHAQLPISSASLSGLPSFPTVMHGAPVLPSGSLDSYALSAFTNVAPQPGAAQPGSRTLAAFRDGADQRGPVAIPHLDCLDTLSEGSSSSSLHQASSGSSSSSLTSSSSSLTSSLTSSSFYLDCLPGSMSPGALARAQHATLGFDSAQNFGPIEDSNALSLLDESWVDDMLAKPVTPPYVDSDEIGFLTIPEDMPMLLAP
eukprot:TRINITY_DN226_c0_g1_i2.p1 TRINITY_DN226_c0_g1~~TRINITY_DN226_c0_g1_i2.p1  ORF type:complete len:506 (-),score=148.91 TRINITY_DN226_c0_g1_i2:1006-2523(-)